MAVQIAALFAKVLVVAAAVSASTLPRFHPFRQFQDKRHVTSDSQLLVDLGYEVYEGVANVSTGLNSWKGIRFAASPTGLLRWQEPQVPSTNRDQVIKANAFGSQCSQSADATDSLFSLGVPGPASEDCLFLNVFSPINATNLPVLVWIHGGGYGLGNGQQDMTQIMNTNNNSFVAVAIQYRLGAFGFLSSDEVFVNGVTNAGLLDQVFALQWVQSYISLFGGNSSHVTIAGVSAGAGSVMLQDMAYGGTLGKSLFTNSIAVSPYLPMQYGYKDWVPSQAYYSFATQAGCFPNTRYGSSPGSIMQCLRAQDSSILQNASASVSISGTYGTYGFLPVTDKVLLQQTPSRQFLQKQLNGQNLLVGNSANEGPLFTPQNISTEADLVAWLQLTFPMFTNDDIAKILFYYPSGNDSDSSSEVQYATSGYTGASAINESSVGFGQQQRANNIYAETTFVCPSYWMAQGYTDKGRKSYKYQNSVLPAVHASDMSAFLGPAAPYQGVDLERAAMTIWGNFITKDNPSIPAATANGNSSTNAAATNPAANWPAFANYAPYQLNLNQSGGVAYELSDFELLPLDNTTIYIGPGLRNNFTLVNAYTWEAGRGYRCDFWRSVAAIVPE